MVKASALHLALVIALVVTILLGSLIYMHYFYRDQQQKIDRWDVLEQEIQAGMSLALSNYFRYTNGDSMLLSPVTMQDSLLASKQSWGLLDVASIRSWRNGDSLKRAFFLGVQPEDSTVLYIVDEDRPISISGKTVIQGDAFLPKSGIRPAFVDGEYYDGIEKMVDGRIRESTNNLPSYQQHRIEAVKAIFKRITTERQLPGVPADRTLHRSFFEPSAYYHVTEPGALFQDSITGNVVIIADSSVTVSALTFWKDALLIAPHIKLEDNFSGQGQFFALDSLTVGKDVTLAYPSVLAVLASDSTRSALQLSISKNSSVKGIVLLHRTKVGDQLDILNIEDNVTVQGDIISFGLLKYTAPLTVHGSVFARRLITQRPSSLYENYLINLTFERKSLHPYFIRPHFWATEKKIKQAVVQWVN
ncbi:hypothetical protein HP439_13450 [Sphingobacterium shayense]|uniref:hypothetical protein n=1 Tax=Sphingobacterium shayense TaxID=626343 RepID=UPI001555B1C3|nr:hypothetical protein [Sphingobacterium shayense]NQD71730.1 hypothetical protein [Sphingobacterium shayense]